MPLPWCTGAGRGGRSQAECSWLLLWAHTEPAGSGCHGAVGVSVQIGAPRSGILGAASQSTEGTTNTPHDMTSEQMVRAAHFLCIGDEETAITQTAEQNGCYIHYMGEHHKHQVPNTE